MAGVSITHRFEWPTAVVWSLMDDFGGVMKYAGGILSRVEVTGTGVGAVRNLHCAGAWGGGIVRERLEVYDSINHLLEYRILDMADLPFVEFYGGFRLTAANPDRCSIKYWSRFEPLGVSEDQGRLFSASSIHGAIDNAEKWLLEHEKH